MDLDWTALDLGLGLVNILRTLRTRGKYFAKKMCFEKKNRIKVINLIISVLSEFGMLLFSAQNADFRSIIFSIFA